MLKERPLELYIKSLAVMNVIFGGRIIRMPDAKHVITLKKLVMRLTLKLGLRTYIQKRSCI